MDIFTQPVITPKIEISSAGETVFFMRSVKNKEYRSLAASYNLLSPSEQEEREHTHYAALIKVLTIRPPVNLPGFDARERDLLDFLTNVSAEELEANKAKTIAAGNEHFSDDVQKEYLLDVKREIVDQVIRAYFAEALNPKRFERSESLLGNVLGTTGD